MIISKFYWRGYVIQDIAGLFVASPRVDTAQPRYIMGYTLASVLDHIEQATHPEWWDWHTWDKVEKGVIA